MRLHPKGYKDLILNYYDQVEIFATYLEIPYETIINCVQFKTPINNPLRIDNNPSLYFVLKDDKLRMIDAARKEFSGDIFDVVGLTIEENSNDPKGFMNICLEIMNSLNDNHKPNPIVYTKLSKANIESNINKSGKVLDVVVNNWKEPYINYWAKHHISLKVLKKERIHPIKEARINDILYYYYTSNNPGFLYSYYKNKKGILIQKWYFPNEKKNRKHRTNIKIQFENVMDFKPSKYLFLVKSTKDRIVFKRLLELSNSTFIKNIIDHINFISLSSETVNFTNKTINGFFKNYDHVFMNVDNDKTGISVINKYSKSRIKVTHINNKSKDIANFAYNNDLKTSINFAERYLVRCLK